MANIQSFVQKFGMTPDMDSIDTNEEIWDGTGAYVFPAAATAMNISSSSTDDAAEGTGARTVTVIGLDEDWREVTQTVTLNGQTGVAIPTSLIRVYRAYVVAVGTGGVNAGDIWIGTGTITAGVPDVRYAGILTDNGQTLMAIYSIPATATGGGLIVNWSGTCGKAQSAFATVQMQIREFGMGWNTKEVAAISEGAYLDDDLTWNLQDGTRLGGVAVGPKADIRLRVKSCGANNTQITGGFYVELLS